MAMFPTMLERDRIRNGFTVGQVAWRIGTTPAVLTRELETGTRSPDWETYDRTCKLDGWPQTFAMRLR